MKNSILGRIAALALIVVLILGSVSCNREKRAAARAEKENAPQGKFKIEKVENFRMNGLTSYELTLRASNPFRYDIKLESGIADILYAGSRLASVSAASEVVVPKRAVTSVEVPLQLSVDNLLTAYTVLGKLKRGETDKITLSVRAKVKAAGMSQNVAIDDIPLSQAAAVLGLDLGNLSGLQNLLNF